MQKLIILALVGAVAGCPGPGGEAQEPVQEGPPLPKDFTPPPPLGAEPPAPDGLEGQAWLEQAHEKFAVTWNQGFLEQCRTFLPPSHALNNASLEATIELALRDDGSLAGAKVVAGSGNSDFDSAALAVVQDGAPYPAPPAELRSDDGLTYVTWRFARDQRQSAVAGARFDRRVWEPARAVPALLAKGRIDDALGRLAQAAGQPGADDRALGDLLRAVGARVLELAVGDTSTAALRADAVRAAGRARLSSAAPALRQLARGAADLGLRRTALVALAALGDAEAMSVFTEAVLELDGDRSAVAAAAMARAGKRDEAWKLCGAKLDDTDPQVRAAALATLAEVGAAESAEPLAARLGDKAAPRAERVAAARALGAVAGAAAAGGGDTAAAIKPLNAALLDGDAAVRAAAAHGIARAGADGYRSKGTFYKLEPLLKDKDPEVRAAAVMAVAAIEPKAAPQSLGVVTRKDKHRTVLTACATALGGVPGPEAVKLLVKLSAHPEAQVKLAALQALAGRAEPEARKALAGLATAADPAVRLLAIRGESDGATLEGALADESLEVRATALERLIVTRGAAGMLARTIDLMLAAAAQGERQRYAEAWLVATSG